MAITNTINIVSITTQTVGDSVDRVMRVGWEMVGTDENGVTVAEPTHSNFPVPEEAVEGGEFIPFADLTEEVVSGWVDSNMTDNHRERMEGFVAAIIAEKLSPPVVSQQLPWLPFDESLVIAPV